jgi:hypothetical protein
VIFEVTLEASAGFRRKKQAANPVKDTCMIFMLALEAAPLARDLLLSSNSGVASICTDGQTQIKFFRFFDFWRWLSGSQNLSDHHPP